MVIESVLVVIVFFHVSVLLYFVLWNGTQLTMGPVATRFLMRHQRRTTRRARALVHDLELPPLVSIVMPAHNEELTIVESVHALRALDYERCEYVVVNDGSTDKTLELLRRTFQLLPAPLAFEQPLATAPVRGIYRSIRDPRIVVIDKDSAGCKADAANAGINAASGDLVLVIDADTVLEREAVSRAVLPFLEDATTVAVGANIGIANGCRIENGHIADVALPRSWLARFQVIEYMRSFLLFRLVCAAVNGVVLISGGFGMFRRDAVIAVGGYDRTAIGEDMDLTLRLQQHLRRRADRFRITFDPNPLAWTQAPEDLPSLRGQRYRWRRGLLQILWRHRGSIGNPRYGVVGLAVLPYIAVFEGIGPLLEISGYVITMVAALVGILNWTHFFVMLAISVLFGVAVTLLSLLLSDIVSQRYMKGSDLVLLVAAALLESCGYRQLNAWWGCVGTYQTLTGQSGWNAMKRRKF